MSSLLETYVAKDGEYIIPVTWGVYSNIVITGVKNLEEAYQVAQTYIDDLPCPEDHDYIDGSYEIENDEDMLIVAQEYTKRGTYFHNPKAEE